MRRVAAFLAVALCLLPLTAAAQESMPRDVPTGDGVVVGRVVHPDRPELTAGLPVILYALHASGEPGIRTVETAADGEFRFEGVSRDPETMYLVGTRIGDIPFGNRFRFSGGENEHRVEITISNASNDATAVRRGSVELRLEWACDGVRVDESHALHNPTRDVIYIPTNERKASSPLLSGTISHRFEHFDAPFARVAEGFEREGNQVRFWGPLHPGSQQVSFGYSLPAGGEGIEFHRGFPDGSPPIAVLYPQGLAPLTLDPLLHPAPPQQFDRTDAALRTTLVSEALSPGSAIALVLPEPPPFRSGLSIGEAQIWLDLDGAALTVNEQYRLEVDGDSPLTAEDGAPLLCLSLPPGAVDLRFAPSTLAMGLATDRSGALAIRGPIPASAAELSIRYRVAVDSEPLTFARRLPAPTALLSLMIADTGLTLTTDRLHRRRPIRTSDRSYLHLEGFEIAADEEIRVTLAPLVRGGGPSARAAAGFVGVVALLCCVFLIAPLRDARAPASTSEDDGRSLEREALYAAIHDLDDDLETGKLSPEDHASLNAELRGRAVALLAQERAEDASRAPASIPSRPASCPGCEAPVRAEDRFCSACGRSLTSAPGPGE